MEFNGLVDFSVVSIAGAAVIWKAETKPQIV
jgi:hypothetical protein